MKKLIACALFISVAGIAQIRGNKNIETRNYDALSIKKIHVNLHANITIDNSGTEKMSITTDSNLFEFINKEVENGVLTLDQLKWISPSKRIKIKIGAPQLKLLNHDTHDTTKVININTDSLTIVGGIGKVILKGRVSTLNLNIKNGNINAEEIIAQNGKVMIIGYGKAKMNVINELDTDIIEGGILKLINSPKSITGNYKKRNNDNAQVLASSDIEWINIRIKNNSWNRSRFVVVGPKKNGRKFSYGFSLMLGFSKKERWTTGTKVYRENDSGLRTLLVTIQPEDKDKTVKLFK